jgi:RNA polymerase sigma-70 factor (ECF subfamily)
MPSPADPDEPSFEQAIDAHYQPLYRFAFSLAKGESEASDLVQQTFYLWAAKGHQLRDRTKIKSWLFTTLHREFLAMVRRRKRFEHEEISEIEHELPSVAPTVANDLDAGTAMDALQEIDEIYRAPLCLFYLDQHSYKEIADILGAPIGTVMSRLSRGKAQLRAALVDRTKKRENKVVSMDSHSRADDKA